MERITKTKKRKIVPMRWKKWNEKKRNERDKVRREKWKMFLSICYIRMHEHTREWPPVSWKDDRAKILTLGFETHVSVSVEFCIQMFVKKYASVVSFVHIDNTIAPWPVQPSNNTARGNARSHAHTWTGRKFDRVENDLYSR